MALTEAEVDKINSFRKLTKPLVFNPDLSQEVPISQDTEDALILTSSSVKVKAVQYLKLLLDSKQETTDADELILEFVNKQIDNEAALSSELSNILGSLDSFREDLVQGNRDDVFTAGFSSIMTLISRALGRVEIAAESTRFHGQFAEFAESIFTGKLNDSDRRSIRSWIRVFLAYP